jgi:cell migration-inducing and hyaluronan-binding protein
MDEGSWVLFELPGFSTVSEGEEQDSLAALRNASDTSYYKDGDKLWVKLVVADANREGPVVEQVGNLTAQANIEVSR